MVEMEGQWGVTSLTSPLFLCRQIFCFQYEKRLLWLSEQLSSVTHPRGHHAQVGH